MPEFAHEALLSHRRVVTGLNDATGLLNSPRDIGPMALANHALRLEADEKDAVKEPPSVPPKKTRKK